ncbi:MAG TPA: hypothetical protein VL096_12220 [Pirellulaceae bacterium]|nr:hypothetical protein [Pirellulaceae bacterium]
MSLKTMETGMSFLDSLQEPAEAPAVTEVAASGGPPLDGNPVSLDSIREAAQAALAKFQKLLAPKLQQLGVDLSLPLVFAVDAAGAVREVSGHPQGAEIEQALADDPALSNTFRQSVANFGLVRAGEEHQKFAELYAKNPELATQQYAYLLDPSRPAQQVKLQLLGDQADVLFE